MKKLLFIVITLTSILYAQMFQTVPESKAQLLQKGKDAPYCSSCGMYLVKFYKTSHAAKVNGKQKQFCSMYCLEDAIKNGAAITDIQVVDTNSLKFIDAKKAYYVVGSKVKGTMSHISKYAFATKDEAQKFQKKHGGKIVSFEEALKIAKKDF